MAPQVQTLAQVMAELNPAFAGQEAVIQKKQAGLGAKYDAQRAGLTAEKGQGFNAINNQATGRGLSFSGIPIDEQATYLSTKFLPGMQAATSQQNDEDLALQGQLAGIGTQKATNALGRIDQQQASLNSWNMQQSSLQAQARESALNRAAQAAEGSANRAASAAAKVDSTTPQQYVYAKLSTSYDAARGKTVKGSAEALIPDLRAQFPNLSIQQARDMVYNSRKEIYKE